MSKLVLFPNLREARRQASLWVVRVDRGLTAEERNALQAWVGSPLHKRALQEMAGLWSDMSVLHSLAEMFPHEAEPAPESASPAYRLRAPAFALAATLVIAVGVGLLVQRQHRPAALAEAEEMAPVQLIETSVGSNRTVALSDGSAVVLNTDTKLAVSFEPGHRDLRLARGEAHFRVAHDARAPFRVYAGGRLIQAVGTAFSVRLNEDGEIVVMVTDGTVSVAAAESSAVAEAQLVNAQQVLTLDSAGHGSVQDLEPVAVDMRLAWQRGMLVFQGEPLAEMLKEFDRYTTESFVIADPQLRKLRVGGYFRAGDVDALLIALRENFNIASSRDAVGRIVLSAAR
jgi:transmembrane sensor